MRTAVIKALIRLVRSVRSESDPRNLQSSRQMFDRVALSFLFRVPCDVLTIDADGVPADWITVEGSNPSRVLVYFHGGGFVSGSSRTHRYLVARILRGARAQALVVDYRLAPECPYPAAMEDAKAAYLWLLDRQIDASRIVVGGDSAGGGLAVHLLQSLRDQHQPLPACCVCISPWVDLSCSGLSMQSNARRDPMLGREFGLERARLYTGQYQGRLPSLDLEDPAVSPLYGDLSELPPMLIQVGSEEVLLDDSRRLAEKAEQAGIEVELQIWQNVIHVWHYFARYLPQGREAIEQIGSFISRHIPD